MLAEVRAWVTALVAWALFAIPIGLAVGRQPFLVQMVGLRSTTFFIPMMLIGARSSREDVVVIARCLMGLNVIALLFAVAEYRLGLQPFYPANSLTEVIYRSNDISGGFHRIPATFISAHAYGGMMAATSPIILWRAIERDVPKREMWLAYACLAATLIGPFLCGARQPVVQLLLMFAVVVVGRTPDMRVLIPLLVVGVLVGFAVLEDERMQRIATLQALDQVERRIGTSVNSSFIEIVQEYPLGAGLASAAGTSIPFFLSESALPAIGIENEYARLALELGLPGLLLWVLFLRWALWINRPVGAAGFLPHAAWAIALVVWSTAFIGTGLLTAIPSTALMMFLIGMAVRHGREAPEDAQLSVAAAPVT